MTATTDTSPVPAAATAVTTGAARPPRGRGRGERGPLASLGLHGTLLIASIVAMFPVGWILFISVGPEDAWQDPAKVLGHLSLKNYTRVLTETDFPRWFGNSVIIAGCTTLLGVLLSATAGYAVSRLRFPGQRQLMWMFLVTQMFPVTVLIVPLYNILASLGLIDSYLGLILTYCTISVPFSAWMLKGYFDTIPMEIDEAGRVDGLTPFGTFWRLILPLARPGLAVTAFYSFLTAWAEVAYATQFMSADHYTLAVGIRTLATNTRADWAGMTAASVMIAIPATIVFFLVQRHLVSGLTAGAAKS
ncbi:sugar ABC transporter permease [Streptomyces sp. NPDC092296]|uniref:sugar ABC transporter permease n=1 Tax=Streptomyces sp. NPDC092296 TaxID=3366012 RepID=UPI003800A79D